MQTLIWYPAEKSGNSPIVFGDYLALSVKEVEPTAGKGSVEFLALLKKRYGDLVNEKTWAVRLRKLVGLLIIASHLLLDVTSVR